MRHGIILLPRVISFSALSSWKKVKSIQNKIKAQEIINKIAKINFLHMFTNALTFLSHCGANIHGNMGYHILNKLWLPKQTCSYRDSRDLITEHRPSTKAKGHNKKWLIIRFEQPLCSVFRDNNEDNTKQLILFKRNCVASTEIGVKLSYQICFMFQN